MDLQQWWGVLESQPPPEEMMFWRISSLWSKPPMIVLYSCVWQVSAHRSYRNPAKAVPLLSPPLPFYPPLHTIYFIQEYTVKDNTYSDTLKTSWRLGNKQCSGLAAQLTPCYGPRRKNCDLMYADWSPELIHSSRFKIPHCRADGFVIGFGYSWQTDIYFDTATD